MGAIAGSLAGTSTVGGPGFGATGDTAGAVFVGVDAGVGAVFDASGEAGDEDNPKLVGDLAGGVGLVEPSRGARVRFASDLERAASKLILENSDAILALLSVVGAALVVGTAANWRSVAALSIYNE